MGVATPDERDGGAVPCRAYSRSGADCYEGAQAVDQGERPQVSGKDHGGAEEGQQVAAHEADAEADQPLLEAQGGAHLAHLVRQGRLLP